MSLVRAGIATVAGVVLACAGLAAPSTAGSVPSDALPAVCTQPSPPTNVYTWVGGGSTHDWENPTNWVHTSSGDPTRYGFPQDDTDHNGSPDRNDTIVCIPDLGHADYVFIDGNGAQTGFVWIAELYVEGQFTLTLNPNNTGLLVDGTSHHSTLGPDTVVDLRGTFGGRATIDSAADITATSIPQFPAQLTSQKIGSVSEETYNGGAGRLVVQPGSNLTFARRGVGLGYDYQLEIAGTATMAAAPQADQAGSPYLAASDGTSVDVDAGGKLTFAGNGGLYQGFDFPNQPKAAFRNFGTIEKTGAGTTSVVDIDYQPQVGGVVNVVAGDLRLPGTDSSAPRQADQVNGGQTFGTGACAGAVPVNGSSCAPVLTAADPLSVSLTAPSDGAATHIVLDEEAAGSMPYTGVSGHVVLAGATAPSADGQTPLTVRIRYAGAEIANQPLSNLQMLRVPTGTDTWQKLPDCASPGQVPAGRAACFDRISSSQETGTNDVTAVVQVAVGGIENADSRYIISRVGAPVDGAAALGAPKVGASLDGHLIAFTPLPPNAAPTGFSYAWSVAGVPLAGTGADGALLTPTAALLGRTLILDVVVSHPDWGVGLFSFPVGPIGPGTPTTVKPTIAKKRTKLIASTGTWTAGTSFTYRWFAGAKKIRGATGKKLKLTRALVGKKVYVAVTGTCPGYSTATTRSKKVKVK